MLRKFILTVIIALAATQAGAFVRGGAPLPLPIFTPNWQPLAIGAGGQISGFSKPTPTSNVILSRNDTNGAHEFIQSGSCIVGAKVYAAPCHNQLVTASSTGSNIDFATGEQGVIEIAEAPSNPNVLYMLWEGALFVTTDHAGHWTQTTLTTTALANDNNSKARGSYIGIDPNNPDIVFIGTPANPKKTTNGTSGASATFSTVTGLAGAATYGTIFAYQPGSSSHIVASVYGTGSFDSPDGGATWNAISGASTTPSQIYVDHCSQFWLIDNTVTTIDRWASGVRTRLTTGSNPTVTAAADPNSSCGSSMKIVVSDFSGQPNVNTTNGNGAWSEASRTNNQSFTASAPQPLWLANANQGSAGAQPNLNGWALVFDTSSNLYFGGGLGVWEAPAPLVSNGTPWAANTLGIEQLVPRKVIAPVGSQPTTCWWDKGCFYANPDVFASNYWNSAKTLNAIMLGFDVDYASADPTFLTNFERSNIASSFSNGFSTDGGRTYSTWTFGGTTAPVGAAIAALDANHWIMVPAQSQGIQVTANQGSTWGASTISGTPTNWLTSAFVGYGFPIAADRVTSGKYCAVTVGQTFYSSTNSGANFATTGLTSASVDGAPNQFALASMPGQAETYYYTAGQGGSGSHPFNVHLWKITKGTNTCDTATNVNANLKEVRTFGFGAAKPGSSFATIYAYGWLNGTLGIQESDDNGATWARINVPAGVDQFPLNSTCLVWNVNGDMDIYGRIYVTLNGCGATYIDHANACPSVKFSNTSPNASIAAGVVSLQAQTSGLPAATITAINFYDNGSLIGAQTSGTGTPATYTQAWTASGVGAHTLKVEAVGNGCTAGGGGNASSIPVTVH